MMLDMGREKGEEREKGKAAPRLFSSPGVTRLYGGISTRTKLFRKRNKVPSPPSRSVAAARRCCCCIRARCALPTHPRIIQNGPAVREQHHFHHQIPPLSALPPPAECNIFPLLAHDEPSACHHARPCPQHDPSRHLNAHGCLLTTCCGASAGQAQLRRIGGAGGHSRAFDVDGDCSHRTAPNSLRAGAPKHAH